uniref:Uncharacterized protein n=1 Tax=Timema douglasi TaxID=61478 RepID=A0A7R8ZBK3_TIMDO|nr:unnamed protein product [Timema douglasi]
MRDPRWSKPIQPLAPLSPRQYPRSRSTPPRCPPGSSRPAISRQEWRNRGRMTHRRSTDGSVVSAHSNTTGHKVLVKLFNDINKRKSSVQHADLQNSLFEEIVSRRFLFVLLLELPSRPLVEIFQLLVILVVQEFRHVAQDRVDGLCLGEPLGALLHVLGGHPSLAQVDVPWDKHTPRLHQPS